MARGKQRGKRGSQNLQFINCENVNIRKIENVNGKDFTNPVKDSENEGGEDDMLNIQFARSSSPNMELAIILVQRLGGTYDGAKCVLMIPDSQIAKHLRRLTGLSNIISQWKFVYVTFRDREVDLYKFLLSVKRTKDCSKDFHDDKHCYQDLNRPGWGCRYLNKIKCHIQLGKNNTSGYWYNYGYFTGEDEWTLNKDLIRHILTTEVRKRGLDLCPFFDFKTLTERINSLPDTITVDGTYYEKVWEMDYSVNPAKLKAIGIRHVPVLTKEEEIEVKRKEMIRVLEKQIQSGTLSEEAVQKRISLLSKIKEEPPLDNKPLEIPLVDRLLYHFSDN